YVSLFVTAHSQWRAYFTFPQLAPSHFELKVLSTFIVCPPPFEVACQEPFACSGSGATISRAPVIFIPSASQEMVPFAVVLVEVVMVEVHSLPSPLPRNSSFRNSSSVRQCFSVVVRACAAEFAF